MFVVVRHGHAGSKKEWDAPDDLRPLDTLGRRQADGLVTALTDVIVTSVFTSPTERCRQTVGPLATARSLPVTDSDLLAVGSDTGALLDLMLHTDRRFALWCTHGEVFSALAQVAVARGIVQARNLPNAKGSAWIVDTGRKHAKIRYVPPRPRH